MRQYIARITKHMLVYKWLHMHNIETCQHEYSFANNETDKHTNVTYSCATNEIHIHLHILPARVYLYVYMYINILVKIYIDVYIYKLGLSHTLSCSQDVSSNQKSSFSPIVGLSLKSGEAQMEYTLPCRFTLVSDSVTETQTPA